MATIPSHEQWMKDTYSMTARRSDALLQIDAALKKPNRDNDEIKQALHRWIFEQNIAGKDWKTSTRNSKGAVTSLYRALHDKRKLSKEEVEAMKYVARAQQVALQKQFMGKTVTFKPNNVVGMAQGAGGKLQRLKTAGAAAKDAHGKVKGMVEQGKKIGNAAALAQDNAEIKGKIVEFCAKLGAGVDMNHVLGALNLGNIESFASNITPFVGAISSGGKALAGWAKVAETAWRRNAIAETRWAIAPADPEAAFDALLMLLTRELASKTGKAGTATVAFSGKLLGTFADAGAVTGPLMGMLETLAEIFQTIFEYVRDYKEHQTANEMLRLGALNLDLFKVCPILGCYFLVVQDHSTIINIAVGEYGSPNFVFDAERLITKVRPVLKQARDYINASPLEIVGFEKAKGIATENWSVKGKFGKLADMPNHIVEVMGEKIVGVISAPTQPVVVDKSRIVGMGVVQTRARSNAVTGWP